MLNCQHCRVWKKSSHEENKEHRREKKCPGPIAFAQKIPSIMSAVEYRD
jgi:hypothetical protein